MRKDLLQDFTQIYHLDLHGNVRKNPKLSGTTHNVFGIQVGAGITIAIRSSQHTERKLFYHCVPEFWRKTEKLAFLRKEENLNKVEWLELRPDVRHTWLTESLYAEFETYLPIGTREVKASHLEQVMETTFFKTYSRGAETTRDSWMYDFSRDNLATKASSMIETYNAEISRWVRAGSPKNIDSFVLADETKIKWSSRLKECLERRTEATFEIKSIRNSLYRPFTREYLYFDSIMTHRQGMFPIIFPNPSSEKENTVICVSGIGSNKPFHALASDIIPCLDLLEKTQCFPYYTYAEDGSNRRENITNWALAQFQAKYGPEVTKWDIFHYVYAMLHHPQYRERYAENLKRDLPHIPLLHRAEAFQTCVRIGKQLMELHLHYEQAKEYPLQEIENPDVPFSYHVEKMRLTPDRGALVVNPSLNLAGIPPQCFAYRLGNRSALEWVIDQYQVSEDKRSGIVSDPNNLDDEEYIVRLVRQVVTVSMETVQAVDELARAVTMDDWM